MHLIDYNIYTKSLTFFGVLQVSMSISAFLSPSFIDIFLPFLFYNQKIVCINKILFFDKILIIKLLEIFTLLGVFKYASTDCLLGFYK